MGKIIIDNQSSKTDYEAIQAVLAVMSSGRVSNNGKQYCYYSRFNNGIGVSSDLNAKSDKFTVINDKNKESAK